MDETSKEIGKHEASIESLKEDVDSLKKSREIFEKYLIERKTERRMGALVLSGLGVLGGWGLSYLPSFISDLFKAKGFN